MGSLRKKGELATQTGLDAPAPHELELMHEDEDTYA